MELLFPENSIDSCVCSFTETFRGCKREAWKPETKSNFMCKSKIDLYPSSSIYIFTLQKVENHLIEVPFILTKVIIHDVNNIRQCFSDFNVHRIAWGSC